MALLQYRFLIGDEKIDSLWLLGIPLRLTTTRRRILFALLRVNPATAEELSEALPKPLKACALSAHVSAINQQALPITNRKLIEYSDGGYRFNPTM